MSKRNLLLAAIGVAAIQSPISRAQVACQPHRNLNAPVRFNIDTEPEDVVITPNKKYAIVRGNGTGSGIVAFDLAARTQIPVTGTFPITGTHLHDCDVVECTDTRVVTIGSPDTTAVPDTTHVNIFEIQSSPAQLNLLRTYSLINGGRVNDVGITPDGTKAVVASRFRIRVFDLTAPGTTPLAEFSTSIASPRWGFTDGAGRSWTDICADSVELTNERAIIQLSHQSSGSSVTPHPAIFILDLTTSTPSTFPSDFLRNDLVAAGGNAPRWAHDLRITPNGQYGLAGGIKSLAMYNLGTGQRVDLLSDAISPIGGAGGLYQTFGMTTIGTPVIEYGSSVDSVVASNTHCVVASDDFGIKIYDISSGLFSLVASQAAIGSHDIQMLNDGTLAAVRMRTASYAIDFATSTPTLFTNSDPSGFDPRGTSTAFVSDSLALTKTPARYVTISTNPTTRQGLITIVNTANGSLIAATTVALDSSTDRLVDLVAVGNFVFVRGTDSTNDLMGFNTCTGQSMGAFNLDGTCVGVDHIEATSNRVITVSVNPTAVPSRGFVDIFSY